MNRKRMFLLLTLLGLLLPMSEFYQFLTKFGMDFNQFLEQLFVNHISTFFAWDLMISSLVFLLWAWHETRKRSMPHFLLYMALNLLLGLSVAFPFFLYIREEYP